MSSRGDEVACHCRSQFQGPIEAPRRSSKENDMTKFILAAASALMLGAAPAQAQLLGNVGGAVGGAVNGTLGGSLNGVGSLGSTVGAVGNVAGGVTGALSGAGSIANSVSAVGSGSANGNASGTVSRRNRSASGNVGLA